ncbi:MAG: ribosome assembly RNA-binding protein YhbY [bacterium]|nr:ribosome assembly RNA-binding protein YhbY [bacterium]
MTLKLTGKQARHLRALGHHLKPIMQIGKGGISPEFLEKLDQALEQHELIKIKLLQNTMVDLDAAGEEISKALHCYIAQKIGKTLMLYRMRKKDSRIPLPTEA